MNPSKLGRIDLRDEPVRRFIWWLYDECPVNPDDVPREKLLSLWLTRNDTTARRMADQLTPTRIIPFSAHRPK